MVIWEAQRKVSVKPGSSQGETPSAPPVKGVSSPPQASPPSHATTSEKAKAAPIFGLRVRLRSWGVRCPMTQHPTFLSVLSLPCTGPSGQAASGLRCFPFSSRELPQRLTPSPLSGPSLLLLHSCISTYPRDAPPGSFPHCRQVTCVDPLALYRGEGRRKGRTEGRMERWNGREIVFSTQICTPFLWWRSPVHSPSPKSSTPLFRPLLSLHLHSSL